MTARHRKKPKFRAKPEIEKKPRIPPPEEPKKLKWSFAIFDNKQWGDTDNVGKFMEIAAKMRSYEGMEIKKIRNRDHAVLVRDMIHPARKRLSEIQLDDTTELWRLRFTGTNRLWGFLDGHVFKVLWWDPQHKICPSRKRHT